LILKHFPYILQLKHPFGISGNIRKTTPVVYTIIEHAGYIGYGESSLPPYLGETQESVAKFLDKIDVTSFDNPLDIESIMNVVDDIESGNNTAKAGFDIALHDLVGKMFGKPLWSLYGIDLTRMPQNSITIGLDEVEKMIEKVHEASDFNWLKIKLGSSYENDKNIIKRIKNATEKRITIDVNQGWKEKEKALELIHFMHEMDVEFIEQPLPKNRLDDMMWLKDKSPLPLFADEDFQTINDLDKVKDCYHGINIKLMKCGGLSKAFSIVKEARILDLKILIGCMNESSCANMAAAQLAPLADYVDLDGPFLITNNPFSDPVLRDGKIKLSEQPGIGVEMKSDFVI